ncbi:MAG: prolyl-tRNA synthetase, partial [Cruoricaptor ignavus]|nr:prolyl-tRNA synthetase [Cruoricaptor ignavus]
MLKSKVVLAVSGGLILASCGVYTGGYSETDGVYYNPNTDVLPQADIAYNTGNHVGDYYDYNDNPNGIIERNNQNQKDWDNRYNSGNWRNSDNSNSDWGTFSGNETNYYNYGWGGMYGAGMYGWGSPWGWNRFGMGLGWGGYYGMGMNFGIGWG